MFSFLSKFLIFRRVYAQDLVSKADTLNIVDILTPARRAFNVLIFISGSLFVIYLIIGAYKYFLSQGDPKAVKGAELTLTHAIIGFGVVIGVFVINKIVANILGISGSYSDVSGVFDMLESGIQDLINFVNVN